MQNFIGTIRNELSAEGYTLLTKFYYNNKQNLLCICPNGHNYTINWNHWTSGRRCPCKSNIRKPSFYLVKKSFNDAGYKLLNTIYINACSTLEYVCPYGHRHTTTWARWNNQNSRCPTCFYINNSGPNNNSWKGGISCEPYCGVWLDKEFKEDIKQRDNYQCQNPDCWGTSKKLVIHHIDYNKKNCSPTNLITLCNSCNIRANKDREWHTKFYRSVLMDRIGKNCYVN